MRLTVFARIAIPAALIAAALPAPAADYPTKPIRLVVGFAPGGGTDTTARAIVEQTRRICSASRSSSTTVPAPPATSRPKSSPKRRLTATRC